MSKRGCKGFWRNENGATAALYALALPALVGIAGVGFDYARLAGMDSELQNAADQAALAAVTQLNGKAGACSRAAAMASGHISNTTLLANDGDGLAIPVANEAACDATGVIRFWQDEAATIAADADGNASFVQIVLGARTAEYAFTPVVGAFSGDIVAAAVAGLSGAICGTAAMFYCNPSLPDPFNADAWKGRGVLVGTMDSAGSGSWGYLKVPPSNNAEGTELALAQDKPQIECRAASATPESVAGSPSGLVRAINTRFDIFDNNIVNNNQPCENIADCAPAHNVLKDVVLGSGKKWELPASPFRPAAWSSFNPYSATHAYDADGVISSMGLPRDLCHYGSYGHSCENGGQPVEIGDSYWPRQDYFQKYHSSRAPATASTMTRYDTYRWEIQNGYHQSLDVKNGGPQYSTPREVSPSTSAFDRRVVTVAFSRGTGGSCPGAGQAVPVVEWVDMFFVEPGVSKRGNYPAGVKEESSDPVYVEIIGRSSRGSAGVQLTHRETPYLVR
jgi:Flp pilus assembly protein TadG